MNTDDMRRPHRPSHAEAINLFTRARMRPSNSRLQRSWPSFSSSVSADVTGVDFGRSTLLPEAGHAAEAQC
jgi:hypothetical protein